MSEPRLISPMLDNFAMGDPISDRNGVRCCPAMEKNTEDKYIVKIISTPPSQTQLEALLLSGAYSDQDAAAAYFKTLADGIADEAEILQRLSQLEGFLPLEDCQVVPMEDACGFEVYLLSKYRNTLQHHFRRSAMTHLGALNLGLDLCAALAVCRRFGYLYVNLKPDNIYMSEENSYRIGDIGFLKLDSLKYASLPDRYRSQYTAPEISDAFSALNTTMDVYTVGLILYQAFNDGALPFRDDTAPAEDFPPPAYADYEMAEIILKACAADPAQRWQDPVEMGQAFVSYMQRNGAHDTPIVPLPIPNEEAPAAEAAESQKESTEEQVSVRSDISEGEVPSQPDRAPAEAGTEETSQDAIYAEDDEGNLTFLLNSDDETEPNAETSDIDYEEVSDEVSEILTQADDLIAHPIPEPVVQPEPIDVPIPPPLPVEQEEPAEDADAEAEDDAANGNEGANGGTAVIVSSETEDTPDDEVEEDDETVAAPKANHWVRNILLIVIGAAILVAGFFFYKNYYLQPIDAILLEEHDNGDLTVLVTSKVDEAKLTVVCSDTYGNQLTSAVEEGKAHFTGLTPDSAYTVKVVINGFHRLTGDTSAAFTTPVQTNIVQFRAVTGSEDGSVVLNFAIDGPDANQWLIRYGCEGESESEITFSGHTVTLTALTIGTEYAFELLPNEDLHITGTTEILYTPSTIIKAADLAITGCIDNTLTVAWSAPGDAFVESWTVRCYSEEGFDETIVVTETNAVFEGVDPATSYTVEVTAAGMSVSERAFATANSITITDFAADDSDPNNITLTWDVHGAAPEGGWILLYTLNDSAAHEVACKNGNTATISGRIPGIKYVFTLQTASGNAVLGGRLSLETAAAQPFSGYGVTAKQMEFKMCKTPKSKNWDRYDLSKSDYTTNFSIGQKASFLIRLRSEYSTSPNKITTLFVIRDENGSIVNTSSVTNTWTKMWYKNYCELDIPSIPQTSGKYTISVYFNGGLATEQSFTVTD